MKKINILLIICLVLTLTPSIVNAKDTNFSKEKKLVTKINNLKNPFIKRTKEVENALEFYKQTYIDDEMTPIYSRIMDDRTKYSDEVIKAAQETYEEMLDVLDDLDSEEEFNGETFLRNFYSRQYYLYDLSELTKKKQEKFSISELKNSFIYQTKSFFNCFSKSSYNDYYYSKITSLKTKSLNSLSKTTTSYPKLVNKIANIEFNVAYDLGDSLTYYYDGYDNEEEYYEDYEEEYYDYDYEDEIETVLESLGITIPNDLYYLAGNKIFSKSEINDLRNGIKIYINNYVDRQFDLYDGDLTEVKNIRTQVFKELNSMIDGNEMVSLCLNTIEQMEDLTGVKYLTVTEGTYYKYYFKIEKIYEKYSDDTIYTESGLEEISDIYYTVTAALEEYVMNVEIPKDLSTRFESLLKKVPTVKVELYNELVSMYKNKAKYDQTKVTKILKEAKIAFNNTTNIDEAYEVYYEYMDRLDATIKKFTITTSKTGKGTVTKTKKVTYGSNYTVKIIPNKGYKIKSITVDGKKIKKVSKYTFKNIKKNHTLKVVFVLK